VTFETPSGCVVVTDALALGPNETGHEIGFASPHILVRRARCTHGRVAMQMRLAARPEYGAILPVVELVRGGAIVRGGAERLVFSASHDVTIDGSDVVARFELRARREAIFAVARSSSSEPTPPCERPRAMQRRSKAALRGWRSWARLHQAYRGPYREHVHLGGRILQALTFQPTGAMVAAPTTSLPETLGGDLNWDYRYCWLRDASMTLDALWIAACPDEAERYFTWLANAGSSHARGAPLQILYGIGGEHDLTERELPHLAGYGHSRPVRIGNGAWTQQQNDVYGAVVGAAKRFADRLEHFDETTRAFVVRAVETAADRWREPDAGIWEIRGETSRFVHSAAMCWVAVDGGIALARALGVAERAGAWTRVRDEIASAIHEHGWSERRGAYVQRFDDDETLDAAALVLVTSGFLAPDDPRAHATVAAIARELVDERGLVRRYDGVDEGAFLLCTFWLAEAQALLGERDAACATFERAVGYANDVGLLAEEVDSRTGLLLGNFPQAFSHLGLINAAWAIDKASRRPRRASRSSG